MTAPTLTLALRSLGYSHIPSTIYGKRTIVNNATGNHVGNFDAKEAWEWIHSMEKLNTTEQRSE